MIFLLFSLFLEFKPLNPTSENLANLNAKLNVVILFFYQNIYENTKDIFNDFIQQNFDNEKGIILRSIDCDKYPDFCEKYSYNNSPIISQYFDSNRFYNLYQFSISNENNEWKQYLQYIIRPKASDIGNRKIDFTKDSTLSGGSLFHLFVKKENDQILSHFIALSRIYIAFNCKFYYTISAKVKTPSLSIFKSKGCMNIIKGNSLTTNLPKIVDDNKFSHFHQFNYDEFSEIIDVYNKSSIVFMTSSKADKYEEKDIKLLSSISNAVCEKYQMGWATRSSHIGEKLRSFNKQAEIIIVNRKTDCLFLIPWAYDPSMILRYIISSFTETQCWRYPEDSTKEIKISYKRLLISLCMSITFFYFSLIYCVKKPTLPINKT